MSCVELNNEMLTRNTSIFLDERKVGVKVVGG